MFKKYLKELECPIFIDGSNVAYHRYNKAKQPLIRDLLLVIDFLTKELKIDSRLIYCICDPGLIHYIDDPDTYKELINQRRIIEASKKADEFILSYAQKFDHCFIVSNDKFKEFRLQLPSTQWLEERRVPFMIIGEKVCLSPIIDGRSLKNLYIKKKQAKKSRQFIQKGRTTLEVIKKMEESSGELNLF